MNIRSNRWLCFTYLFISSFFSAIEIKLLHAEETRVLFLGDNGHHKPRARFDEIAPVLAARGIELTYTDNVDDLTRLDRNQYPALVLYANIDSITPQQASGLLNYVLRGGGFVPLHCASFCFRNNDDVVALIGAQFKRHGTGIFRTITADPNHPIMKGLRDIESWDETYVHSKHNEKDRQVLQFRVDESGREPWTWVRTHGEGRVFYTAWGHDERTWSNAGFIELVERGIRWTCKQELKPAASFNTPDAVPVPKMTSLPPDKAPFEFVDVGAEIPNYMPSEKWGVQGAPKSQMQLPLPPNEAIKRIVTPEGFRVELFVSEPELVGKPIAMTWDERGRLWVAETYDYPNELQPPGQGRDRIRICEDTDGDGRADKFTVFAEKLSIPTSMIFSRGSVIVQNGVETLRLTDTDGDDVADQREVLISGWELGDTHGGVSNFQYGLDNWVWAMQGYNTSKPVIAGKAQDPFRMGFFRFKPDGSKLEFIRSTNNNTWGLGLGEEGLVFGSTANGNPSVFMPIPNRYYERVRGWAPSLTLSSIADTNRFEPIVDNIRQVDHHGGYTAGAGHALYTGRHFPKEYWNRIAFVNGPTGHLVGSFVLDRQGFGYRSTSPFNLFASDDEWSAPIMAEVGPDGAVWVLDWYNFIVQHNPTPNGFETGKGRAYETKLRDKKHGRIYRIVYNDRPLAPTPNLTAATSDELVDTLRHPTMLVRKHAQRLLVERADLSVLPKLIELIGDNAVDEAGLNTAAIHALWVLEGLKLNIDKSSATASAIVGALRHPSPGVRRNAIQVLPQDVSSIEAILDAGVLFDIDAQVRLAATLALSDMPPTPRGAEALTVVLRSAEGAAQMYLRDAATSAAANHGTIFLQKAANADKPSGTLLDVVTLVAGHYARSGELDQLGALLASLKNGQMSVAERVITGLASGTRDGATVKLDANAEADMQKLLNKLPTSAQVELVSLASKWGSTKLKDYAAKIEKALVAKLADEKVPTTDRIAAARQIIEFQPTSDDAVETVLEQWSARTDSELAGGIIDAIQKSRAPSVGSRLIERLPMMTPGVRSLAIQLLLKRPEATVAMLDAAEAGDVSIDDLTLDQQQALAAYPDEKIATRAKKLMASGGSLPNSDRQKVLDELTFVTKTTGDVGRGKEVFNKHCATCHIHSGEGAKVGPELTGMAVHPKIELLTHIIDPSRSVESNFKLYTVMTSDGSVFSGTLASESKTAIDLFDAQGKRRAVLREDIEEMVASRKSIMPEGFEKQVTTGELTDLLEFMTARGDYLPMDLSKVATISSGKPMFTGKNPSERLLFDDWSKKQFQGIPFNLLDPQDSRVANVILLQGPEGQPCHAMPRQVDLPCNGRVKVLHLLSGVSGWGHPLGRVGSVSMIVRLHYDDRKVEDHPLQNGIHFADYIRRIEVPESQFAFDLGGRQIRYLTITPARENVIEKIEFLKGSDGTAPVVMAVTVQSKQSPH
jgi:putative membrane-bound dehydrogenase-like protein